MAPSSLLGAEIVAAALQTPSVVVSCGADVSRWAPLDTARHRVASQPVACRPCAFESCPVGHLCAVAVDPRSVSDLALEQLHSFQGDRHVH